MGGGGGGNTGEGSSFFSEDGEECDPMAMLGVLASIKGGASGLWDAYNEQLAQTPIVVKV